MKIDNKTKKQITEIINLMEDAKTIDDGKIGHALLKLYNLKQEIKK